MHDSRLKDKAIIVIGSGIIGAAIACFDEWDAELLRLLLVTGLLGGLTTFSAFSAESHSETR